MLQYFIVQSKRSDFNWADDQLKKASTTFLFHSFHFFPQKSHVSWIFWQKWFSRLEIDPFLKVRSKIGKSLRLTHVEAFDRPFVTAYVTIFCDFLIFFNFLWLKFVLQIKVSKWTKFFILTVISWMAFTQDGKRLNLNDPYFREKNDNWQAHF